MKNAVLVLSGAVLILATAVAVFSAGDVAAGKIVYAAQKCQLCHSIAGVGNKKWPLDGVGARLKAEDIVKWTKTPKEMKANTSMKAYPNISNKDMDDLTAYMLSLK